jgi:hypothetical protein
LSRVCSARSAATCHPSEGFNVTVIRRPGGASATVLVVLGLSLVTAHAIAPEWSRRAGLDVWNLPSLEEEFRVINEERLDVEAHAEQSANRRVTANLIARKLADGQSLATAVDEMMEVFQDDRAMRCSLESMYSDAPTPRHRFALHTIDRVKRLLKEDPLRCRSVAARLEAEYKALETVPESPQPR